MTFIDSWDSGEPGAFWDSGLQWDVNIGPNFGDVVPYLDRITSEHRNKPKFVATLTALLSGVVDTIAALEAMPAAFDLDLAVGAQLDKIGEWVGITRDLNIPIAGVYFAFNTLGVGWNQGVWQGPGDPTGGLVVLPDAQYRTLLKAKIANNQWDGTIPGAYEVWDILFAGTGTGIDILDNQDMTMVITVTGPPLDALTAAIVTQGYLNLKPAGVSATYVLP